jgi:hypothetical protein
MAETRRKFDLDFKEGAVRLVRETGRPIPPAHATGPPRAAPAPPVGSRQ